MGCLTDADHAAIAALIGRTPAPPAPRCVRQVLVLALDAVRVVDDPIAIDAIDLLAGALADTAADLTAIRQLLSETLAFCYRQQLLIIRHDRARERR